MGLWQNSWRVMQTRLCHWTIDGQKCTQTVEHTIGTVPGAPGQQLEDLSEGIVNLSSMHRQMHDSPTVKRSRR